MMVVVDTNVALVANERVPQASPACVMTCAQRLLRITRGAEKLVIDNTGWIIGEYGKKLHHSGQPGVGDFFFKWVVDNQAVPERCELVPITPVIDDRGITFEEFPSDPTLSGFHYKDRMFVAVALAHEQKPPILQAVDTKWWNLRDVLLRYCVKVEFLCEDDIRRMLTRRRQ